MDEVHRLLTPITENSPMTMHVKFKLEEPFYVFNSFKIYGIFTLTMKSRRTYRIFILIISLNVRMCIACQLHFSRAELATSTKGGQKVLSLTYTHTNNRFTALLDFVQDYPGELAPER